MGLQGDYSITPCIPLSIFVQKLAAGQTIMAESSTGIKGKIKKIADKVYFSLK